GFWNSRDRARRLRSPDSPPVHDRRQRVAADALLLASDSASPAMPRRGVSARAACSLIARSWSLMGACADGTPLPCSARFPHCRALGFDASYQVIPRFHKRRSAFVLQLRRQRIDSDARLCEAGQNHLAVAPIRCEQLTNFAVLGEGLKRSLGHSVDGEGCGERLHIKDIGRFGILGAGARPEEAL